MKLFDDVEGKSVRGLNVEVLKLLVSMYLKKGIPRENPNPYLADYKVGKMYFFFNRFAYIVNYLLVCLVVLVVFL